MRKFALVVALMMSAGTLFAATPASANGDCGTPGGGTLVIFSRAQAETPAGAVGRSLVNAGAAGCSLLTYTEDDKDAYGVDTRVLQPGANAIQIRWFGPAGRPTSATVNTGQGNFTVALNEVVSATGSITYDSAYFTLPGAPAPFSGRVRACAQDACATYESVDRYQCDELFVDERDVGVTAEARPCTNVNVL